MGKNVTIFNVADYFLSKLDANPGSSITPLKLQKLVYYAQAWSLVWEDNQLFDEPMEAWAHGPANPELYQMYKDYGWNNIGPVDFKEDSIFTKDQLETMDVIWDDYGDYDGKFLERLTHQEMPWIEARGDCGPGQYCDNVIDLGTVKRFYTEMYESESSS